MLALKFNLYGAFAHFKDPENNYAVEVSYKDLPKTYLLGILGAILGLRGLNDSKELGHVEYIEELKGIKVGIIPKDFNWRTFIDTSVNALGFGNDRGNQIIRKQVLQDVAWDIYILKDSIDIKHWNRLQDLLLKGKSTYPLGLGKKKFKARTKDVEIVELERADEVDNVICKSLIEVENIKSIKNITNDKSLYIKNQYLPTSYNENMNYNLKKFVVTNSILDINADCNKKFFKNNNEIICFF